jgi:uncharacterized protein with PQ loop repeat
MDPWDLLIIVGSTGFVLCLIPQLVKTVRSRHADDISLGFLVLVLASSGVTLPYEIHIEQYIFATAQGANLLVWGTVLYYKLHPTRAADHPAT